MGDNSIYTFPKHINKGIRGKCKQPRRGFELRSPILFPSTIILTPEVRKDAPSTPYTRVYIYIYIYTRV